MTVVSTRLQRNFSAAAADYDAHADFQHRVTHRVLDAALMLFADNTHVLDIGCGTGYFAHAAGMQGKAWQVIGVDIAPGMCAVARTRCPVALGDAGDLPIASNSIGAAISSLCYQWLDPAAALNELVRVLKPGGRAIIATLGPATLQELHAMAVRAALPLQTLPMHTLEAYIAIAQAAGLAVTFSEKRATIEIYPDVAALLHSMRAIGAGNNFANVNRGLTSPKRWQAMLAAYDTLRTPHGLPATWEHLFLVLHKPA